MGLFDVPKLDPAEVLAFYEAERVASLWFRGRVLGGVGAPKLACLECVGAQLTLYDALREAEFTLPVSEISVKGGTDTLRLDAAGERYKLAAVDVNDVRRRGRPVSYLAYMDHFQVLDRVPGMGAFNQNFGVKGTPARKGVWVGLWRSLLVQRGAREL